MNISCKLSHLYLFSAVVLHCSPPHAYSQETPACVSAANDTDGDGWGWENNSTCRVVTDVNSCIDTDGDGWGWGGTRSCLVGNTDDATNASGNGRITVSSENFPAKRVLIPRVSNQPTIDGIAEDNEWNNAVEADVADQPNWIDNLLVREQGDFEDYGPHSRWRAMHDGTNLYIRIDIPEEHNNEFWQDSARVYHDDSIEIYIDGDNSKNTSYDGVNDYMFALRYVDTMPDFIEWGERGSRTDLLFHYGTNHAIDPNTYYLDGRFHRLTRVSVYELSIDLNSADITIGQPFGLEIQINEDDDGGNRDAKWAWAEQSAQHRAWFDPSVFGTATLQIEEIEDETLSCQDEDNDGWGWDGFRSCNPERAGIVLTPDGASVDVGPLTGRDRLTRSAFENTTWACDYISWLDGEFITPSSNSRQTWDFDADGTGWWGAFGLTGSGFFTWTWTENGVDISIKDDFFINNSAESLYWTDSDGSYRAVSDSQLTNGVFTAGTTCKYSHWSE